MMIVGGVALVLLVCVLLGWLDEPDRETHATSTEEDAVQ